MGQTQPGRMLDRVERVAELLENGGALFVFPEGKRSRDGTVGPFKTGAFKLARLLDAPIEHVLIQGTRQVFAPGRFLLSTCTPRTVELIRLEGIDTETIRNSRPDELAQRSRSTFLAALTPGPCNTLGR